MSLQEAHAAMRAREPLPAALAARQDTALTRFLAAGFPSLSDEDWRYTNLRPFKDAALVAANAGSHYADSIELGGWRIDADPARLELPAELPQGVTAISLRQAIERDHPLLARLGTVSPGAAGRMGDLNAAFAGDALLIGVADGARIDQPLIIDWQLSAESDALVSPRLLLVAGARSEVTLVERRVGRGSFCNAVTEVIAEDGAQVRYVEVSRERAQSHTVARIDIDVARDARFDAFSLALGGTLTRNDVHVRLAEPGASVALHGTFVAGPGSHIDNHTTIDHVSPDTHSVENYRGIIGRAGHGVFNGKVIVRKDAQRITSAQSNDNLLLDDSAEIDTKPELQIYADDVRCSHGATIGRLDEQALFYLRSRGLDPSTAQRLLLDAFAAATLGALAPNLREVLVATLTAFLSDQLSENLT